MPKYFNRLPLRLCVLVALTVTVCVLSSTVAAAPAAQPAAKAPKPTHWWPANGTARDRIGKDDGQLLNGATYTSGFSGQAFHFNGQGSEVDFDEVGGTSAATPSRSRSSSRQPRPCRRRSGGSARCATPQASGTFG